MGGGDGFAVSVEPFGCPATDSCTGLSRRTNARTPAEMRTTANAAPIPYQIIGCEGGTAFVVGASVVDLPACVSTRVGLGSERGVLGVTDETRLGLREVAIRSTFAGSFFSRAFTGMKGD